MLPNNTIIVTDSSCDLTAKMIEELNIRVVPLRIISSTREYRDRIEITDEQVYALMEKEIPSTSLPLPEDVESCYENILQEGYKNVLHISMSSGLSGTFNMVNIVAESFVDRLNIHVVDSKTLAGGLGLLVLLAHEKLMQGKSIEETIQIIHQVRSKQQGIFVVQTLEYLRKGGRIGMVEGVVGSLLNIKPIVYVNDDGVYETFAKGRGIQKAKRLMLEKTYERYKDQEVDVYIVHGMVEEEAKEFANHVQEKFNVHKLYFASLSPVLGIHTGKGMIGFILQPRS